MTAGRRWLLVALGTLLLLGAPVVVRALPADDSEVTAATLLARVHESGPVAYSGFVESAGTLQLPVTDQFSDLAGLLGERTRLRVWWRGDDEWRVDAITTAGETDLVHSSPVTTYWDYERELVTSTIDSDIRLPRTSDLLPPQLGRLVLRDARPGEVSRIDAERVAGIDAPGLRLMPAEPQSTIDHVDVWVDPDSGLPLRVAAYGAADDTAAMTTEFADLTLGAPPAETVSFQPPPYADVEFEELVDVAGAAERFAPVTAPPRLAGLGPRPGALNGGAVGEYGRGVTTLVAIPLWDHSADPLRDQLADTPGVVLSANGSESLSVGPLELLLATEAFEDHSWLVAGTVSHATLVRAAEQLRTRAVEVSDP